MLFLVENFLDYQQKDFPKVRGYVGFESGGYCGNPAEYADLFISSNSTDCALDNSGYFNPKCRPWYQKQKENADQSILVDLYTDAGTNQLLSSICASLEHPRTKQFYGAICMDIDMIQTYF